MLALGLLHKSPSKTLGLALSFFCLGILMGPLFVLWPSVPFFFLACVAIVCALSLSNQQTRFVLILIACLFVGIFRYQQSVVPTYLVTLADRTEKSIRIEAVVHTDVERRSAVQQTILSNVRVADESVYGKLLVRFPLYPEISYGDIVNFTCFMNRPEPFNGFAYDRQLASRGVLAVCSYPQFVSVSSSASPTILSRILDGRNYLIDRLQRTLPEPHASFVSGLLFGGSSSLSTDLKDDFSRTGTSHILAASGFNVSLFSVFLLHWLLQSPLGRRRGLITTCVLLVFYVIAAGATASVVRAGVMASLLLIQSAIGRKASMINVVLLALTFMLLVNPQLLLNDVGFQLSFVATSALLFILPSIEKLCEQFPNPFGLRTVILSSFVAIVFTLPILLWHFGQISLIAPFVNALILPFIPFLMALSAIMLAVSVFSIPLGSFFAIPVVGLSYGMLRIIHLFGSLPFASVSIFSSKLFAIVVIFILLYLISKRVRLCADL